jgi:hypothetical protein
MTVAVMLAIAAHVWPVAPCGQPHVEYVTQPPLQVEYVNQSPQPFEINGPCTLYVRRSDSPVTQCTDIVHQWGHIDGLHHSSDPQNVMYAAPQPYWRCYTKRGIHGFTRQRWIHPPTSLLQ